MCVSWWCRTNEYKPKRIRSNELNGNARYKPSLEVYAFCWLFCFHFLSDAIYLPRTRRVSSGSIGSVSPSFSASQRRRRRERRWKWKCHEYFNNKQDGFMAELVTSTVQCSVFCVSCSSRTINRNNKKEVLHISQLSVISKRIPHYVGAISKSFIFLAAFQRAFWWIDKWLHTIHSFKWNEWANIKPNMQKKMVFYFYCNRNNARHEWRELDSLLQHFAIYFVCVSIISLRAFCADKTNTYGCEWSARFECDLCACVAEHDDIKTKSYANAKMPRSVTISKRMG